ncbi:MAG: BRO-N domain-containing protein [Xenococcaceae cyanobacterium]
MQLSKLQSCLGIEVRFVEIDGVYYANGSDCAKALNFSNPSRDIVNKVWAEYRFKFNADESVGQPGWWLNEYGVHQLLFASDHPKAVQFQRWVFEEVLPKLRAEGLYVDRGRFSSEEHDRLMQVVSERNDRIALLEGQKLDTQIFLNQQREKLASNKSKIDKNDRIQFAFDTGEVNDTTLKAQFFEWAKESAKPNGYNGDRWVSCYWLKNRFEDKHRYIPHGCMVLWLEELGFALRKGSYQKVNNAHNYEVYFVVKNGEIQPPTKSKT